MEQFLRSCVDRYLEVAGNVELKKVPTPGPHEETKDHPRAPTQTGPSVECNWCGNRVPANGYETPSCKAGGTSEGAHPEPVRGQLAPHAASMLMKILYGARIARFDLLKQVNRLARNITRRTTDDDKKLHHLMCYTHLAGSKICIWQFMLTLTFLGAPSLCWRSHEPTRPQYKISFVRKL